LRNQTNDHQADQPKEVHSKARSLGREPSLEVDWAVRPHRDRHARDGIESRLRGRAATRCSASNGRRRVTTAAERDHDQADQQHRADHPAPDRQVQRLAPS
jgi:hypothetical protein